MEPMAYLGAAVCALSMTVAAWGSLCFGYRACYVDRKIEIYYAAA